MAFQSTKNEKYYKNAELLIDLEADLKKASHNRNIEVSEFSRKLLKKIEESREKTNGDTS